MSDKDRALARLQDPSGDAVRALAALVVQEATATPIRDIAEPRWMAGQLATAIEASTRGSLLERFASDRLREARDRWGDDPRPLRDIVPDDVDAPLRELLRTSWVPDRGLTERIIDHGIFRELLAEVLESTLRRFVHKIREVDQEHLGGVGKKARTFGRGIGKGLLGGVAENLVGTVRGEFEHLFERRIRDSLGGLTNEALKVVARHLTDPDNADDYGKARVAVLEVLLDTPIAELAAELDKTRPEEIVALVAAALRASASRDDFVEVTTERIERALEVTGGGTLGAWLDEIGLREVWTESTTDLVSQRLQAVVTTDAFVDWWTDLFA